MSISKREQLEEIENNLEFVSWEGSPVSHIKSAFINSKNEKLNKIIPVRKLTEEHDTSTQFKREYGAQ